MALSEMALPWDESQLPCERRAQVMDQDIEDALTILEVHGDDPNWFKLVQDLNQLLLR